VHTSSGWGGDDFRLLRAAHASPTRRDTVSKSIVRGKMHKGASTRKKKKESAGDQFVRKKNGLTEFTSQKSKRGNL